MDITSVGMRGGMTKRTMQQAVALMVGLMMLLSSAAHATVPHVDLGKPISIIVSKLNPADPRPEDAVRRVGGVVGGRLAIVDGFEAKVPERAVPALATVPGVRGLMRNAKVKVAGVYGENSGLNGTAGAASAMYTEVTRASKVWGTGGATGKGVGVALIDTGVDVSGDLNGRVAAAADFSGENAPLQDSYGHGTFVAGLIAGTGAGSGSLGTIKGIAPEAHIFSVKIAGRDGSTNIFRLLAALEFVAVNKDAWGIRVLNLSLGTDSTQSYLVDPLNFAIERIWNSGIVVVAAAGNSGKIVKPADDPLVVTVGTSDDRTSLTRTDDVIPSFSGVGPTAAGVAKPDLVAPGRSVVSSRAPGSTIEANFPNAIIGDRYFKGSGTSFSAAVVSGVAALIAQKNWTLSPNQIKQRLVANSRQIVGYTSSQQGAGEIDAYNAVTSTDTSSANQGVVTGNGSGSLQGSAGTACYRDVNTGACVSDSDLFAAVGFNRDQYFGAQWAGQQWTGTQWTGTQWTGTQWTGTQWTGTQWTGTQWTGQQWTGQQWTGQQWTGTQWTGQQWTGTQWTGQQWTGTQWTGQQWTSSGWLGQQWTGQQWTGTQWTGTQWTGTQWTGTQWTGGLWASDQWNKFEWLGQHWN